MTKSILDQLDEAEKKLHFKGFVDQVLRDNIRALIDVAKLTEAHINATELNGDSLTTWLKLKEAFIKLKGRA